MVFLFIWLMCGVIAYMIAAPKGKGCVGFAVGMLFGPLGIVFALVDKGNRKTCLFCKELMHEEATVCPHCQRDQIKKDSEGDAKARNKQKVAYTVQGEHDLAAQIKQKMAKK